MTESEEQAAAQSEELGARPILAGVLAWVVPGLGHLYLGRRGRAAIFFSVIGCAIVLGCVLHGNLYHPVAGQPLTTVATLGAMGMGLPYFVLRFVAHYAGVITDIGYEYGTAFLLTAGLMNLLLVLDAWDIARGVKD